MTQDQSARIILASKLKELAAAEDLDDLEECEPFDSQVFDGFWDEFLGAEEIDRYTVEAWFIIPDSDDEGEVIGRLMYLATENYKPDVKDTIIRHEEGFDIIPSNLDLSSMETRLVKAAEAVKDVKPVWVPDKYNTFPGRNKLG